MDEKEVTIGAQRAEIRHRPETDFADEQGGNHRTDRERHAEHQTFVRRRVLSQPFCSHGQETCNRDQRELNHDQRALRAGRERSVAAQPSLGKRRIQQHR